MQRLTTGAAALAAGAALTGSPDRLLGESIIDSRQARPGTVFWALPGTRADGHDYVARAYAAGCEGTVVSRACGVVPDGAWQLLVPEVPAALQQLAVWWRGQFDLPVWGVTGSNGKTSTKEMLAWLLAQAMPTLATAGNRNNDLGVPLTLLRLQPEHRALVLELGMNHAGELARLAQWSRPTAGLLTNVGASHLEFFGTLDNIARAKAELAAALPAGAPLVVNADNRLALDIARRHPQLRAVTFGALNAADFRAADIAGDADGSQFVVNGRQYRIPLAGRHQVLNATAALAAFAVQTGALPPAGELFAGLAVDGRMEWREHAGVRFLVDCYNANPLSAGALLESLPALAGGRRVILVFGDMLELGAAAAAEHAAIGVQSVPATAVLITVGELARGAAAAARAAGHRCVEECADAAAAGALLRRLAAPGDVVALKASRGVRLERALAVFTEQAA
ncbi:MAG TPA: UDP-N-acetylmuramoyl-tripeptide--D-alanyl-D-alanine ligase [bacterium]|nr:UDP-N-acetylmuramoyl-tripeptide--D-alanyl-D-alanine ligase [bacterium]